MKKKTFSLDTKIVSSILVSISRFLTGIRARQKALLPENAQCIYYANHSSHLDGLVIWSCLTQQARSTIHPVAAADYWNKTKIRRYIANRVFKAVLIQRKRNSEPSELEIDNNTEIKSNIDPLVLMQEVLDKGESLIIFPEGTRGDGENIQDFKSGLWHLSRKNPNALLVPVYLENLNRVLPKGSRLVVPIICTATFAEPIPAVGETEDKAEFLLRAKEALEVMHNEIAR